MSGVFLEAINELNPDRVTDNPNIEKYLIKPHKRPKLKVKEENGLIIFSRREKWYKPKQVFIFPTFLDKGFDILSVNFLLFYQKFLNREMEINNTQSLKDFIDIFEQFNLFIIPKLTNYIKEKITTNEHMYIRFITMVHSLETLIDPKIIAYVKWCYLKAIIDYNSFFIAPKDNNKILYVNKLPNVDAIHEYLDMITYFSWGYLLFVYRFNKYSEFDKYVK